MSGSPDLLFDELIHEIREHIAAHPRTLQTRIGPSEIGEPCARRLGHKLAGTEPPDRGDKWRATVGTAVHSWLEEALTAANARWEAECGAPRFLLEDRVAVGHIGGVEITGSTDVFDTVTSTVIDWKSASKTRLARYKREGATRSQRVQAHTYGKGWVARGFQVDAVMLVFVPRDGNLSDAFSWSEPFDPAVADEAFARANRIDAAVKVLGDLAYTETNGQLIERGFGMLSDPGADLDALALPLDFTSCHFCSLLNHGCEGDAARISARSAKAFQDLIA